MAGQRARAGELQQARLNLFGEMDIQEKGSHPSEPTRLCHSLTESEKRSRVIESQQSNGGNVTLAASHLRISRRTVQRILRKEKQMRRDR
jgi:ActR/RegA family two-component response regulator